MLAYFSRLGLVQRIALACGGFCLLSGLLLVGISGFSGSYLLQQQADNQGRRLAAIIADRAASQLDTGELLSLKASLGQALADYGLQHIGVYDIEERQIGAAGKPGGRQAMAFHHDLVIDGNIAGKVLIELSEPALLRDRQRLATALLFLALLLSLFAAALSAALFQQPAQRLRAATERLQAPGSESLDSEGDEIAQLEASLDALPLELLRTPEPAGSSLSDYEASSLVFIRLHSLSDYLETLDEASLLRFTEFQRRLVAQCAEVYGGELSTVRQFGLLLSFSGAHASGSPALRACCVAWLLRDLVNTLQGQIRLRLSLGLALGISEAGTGSATDIYPALYSQHVIDELAALTAEHSGDAILLSDALCADEDVQRSCETALAEVEDYRELAGLEEAHMKLLARQRELLREQLAT